MSQETIREKIERQIREENEKMEQRKKEQEEKLKAADDKTVEKYKKLVEKTNKKAEQYKDAMNKADAIAEDYHTLTAEVIRYQEEVIAIGRGDELIHVQNLARHEVEAPLADTDYINAGKSEEETSTEN